MNKDVIMTIGLTALATTVVEIVKEEVKK